MNLNMKIYQDDLNEKIFQVTHLEGFEEISKPFVFNLDVLSAIENKSLSQKKLTLELEWEKARRIQGLINEYTELPKKEINGELLFSYRIQLCSMLLILKGEIKTVAYINESLENILRKILQNSFKMNIQIQIRLKNNNYEQDPVIIQYEENDFDFFHRIIKKYQLYYISFFSKKDGVESILITDNLSLNDSSIVSFQDKKNSSSFASASHATDQIFFFSKEFGTLKNCMSYSGQGQFIVNGIANNLSLCQHPIHSFNQNYSIIALKTSVQNQINSNQFLVEFTLLDSKTELPQYKQSSNHPVDLLLTAEITADNDNEADLDDFGQYSVYLHCSDKPLKADKSTFRVPLLKDYQGGDNQSGSHLSFSGPLLKGTVVLLQWIYTENSLCLQPVIVGVLPNENTAKILTEQDPSQMMLRHHEGSQLSLRKNQLTFSSSLPEADGSSQSKISFKNNKITTQSPSIIHEAKNISNSGKLKKTNNSENTTQVSESQIIVTTGVAMTSTLSSNIKVGDYLLQNYLTDFKHSNKSAPGVETVVAMSFKLQGITTTINTSTFNLALNLAFITFFVAQNSLVMSGKETNISDKISDFSTYINITNALANIIVNKLFKTTNYNQQKVVNKKVDVQNISSISNHSTILANHQEIQEPVTSESSSNSNKNSNNSGIINVLSSSEEEN